MPDNSDNKPKKIELLSGMMLGLHRREQSISSQLATTETKIDNFLFTVVLGENIKVFYQNIPYYLQSHKLLLQIFSITLIPLDRVFSICLSLKLQINYALFDLLTQTSH